MAEQLRLICVSAALTDAGKGVRFELQHLGQTVPAFVVRYRGRVYAYLNRCAHIPVEMDWQEGEFFDISGLYLLCSTHGAMYLPATGQCMGGRCAGKGLVTLAVQEHDGYVYLIEEANHV
ncbi:MAG: Rieske (2Fe-2S) protein [Sulfuriferula sp.]